MAHKVLFETELTDIESSDVEGVGAVRYDDVGNVDRWVKNTHSTTVTQYGACVYDGATRTQCGVPVTLATSGLHLSNAAGLWHAAVTTGAYGWIRCKGKGTGIIAASIPRSVGMVLTLAGAAETLTSLAISTIASDQAIPVRHHLIVSPASAASAEATSTCTVLIDCML